MVYTTNTASIQKTEVFANAYNYVAQIIPTIKKASVQSVESVDKEVGTQFTIVTIDNGLVNQVVVQTDRKTKESVILSVSNTPVAVAVEQVVNKQSV